MKGTWQVHVSVMAAVAWLAVAMPASATASAATVTDDRGASVSFEQTPARIIALLPSLTETVCELGGCERLVGTDRFSNWPDPVKDLPKLGGLEDAQIERIYALKPDLVLVPKSARVIDRLDSLGLKVLALESQSLADVQRTVGIVAQVLGRPEAGAALLARIEARTRTAAGRIPAGWRGARVYFEVAATPHAAGEASFIGQLLGQMGLANAVPAALGPFPKLNPEYVVRAGPDLLMAGARNLAGMAQRPGWGTIAALSAGHTCGFNEEQFDILIRPGPRLGEAAELLAGCIAGLPPRPGEPR